jgi:DNA (cytosine-5)-methyltransferase 1
MTASTSSIPRKIASFQFIDLFAGIGGTRLAFEKAGGQCVFSSEWDKHSQITYAANHGEKPAGDIHQIESSDIPDHNVLVAGFPCQPFSIAGVSKKLSLGRKHGFDDERQGNLFFEIARILNDKRPEAFLLENVKNLRSHDKGKTFQIISTILDDLNYDTYIRVIDAKYYVPQHRERIFIVGFDRALYSGIEFQFPEPPISEKMPRIADILETSVDSKYTLTDHLWQYLQAYKEKHQRLGNGFGFGLFDPETDFETRTLSARYHKDGSEILIKQPGKNPRRLTPRECARLMGFDDSFKIVVSDTQAYRQFGNSVVVPVVADVAHEIVRTIALHRLFANNSPVDQSIESLVAS